MPLSLPANLTDDYFVVADAALATGQTCKVISADPATVVITEDSVVRPDPSAPAGESFTIASGKVSAAAAPAQPATAISCSASVTNADGSAGPSQSDTVTIIAAGLTKIGFLFGTPA
jgi:hypothetical protein